MDVNPYSSSIQSFVGVQSNSLEKISTAQAVNKASDDPSALAIADTLGVKQSSISQAIQNFNSGIAMSAISQDAISNQKDLLEQMRTETLKAMSSTTSDEGKDAIADQISKYMQQFDQIADTTNYNGTSLLKTAGDISDDISIVGDESTIPMEKADTVSISIH
jgi:flagellin